MCSEPSLSIYNVTEVFLSYFYVVFGIIGFLIRKFLDKSEPIVQFDGRTVCGNLFENVLEVQLDSWGLIRDLRFKALRTDFM